MNIINEYPASVQPKYLHSEIIHQKKQLIFQVEQTTNHVFPNEDYKYYIYLKNISGVEIRNIHIKVNNPAEIFINEQDNGEDVLQIKLLKPDEAKFIYLRAKSGATGIHHIHFICYGDGTGLYYQTLKLHCSYTSISDELIHKLHIYDFTPYEDTYFHKVGNFNDQTTQLFKTQKLPFQAGKQPFPMQNKDSESSPEPFSNTESESFLNQLDLAKNTKEHVYQYISRENFNANAEEAYVGKNLQDLVNTLNRNSKLFKATLLKTGTNELATDFQQYEPNGFIHRFGLLNSEIYHYLGTLPTYSYMSDFLFRWAPDGREPLNLYPQKIAMKWNQKKWTGRGWVVYRIATEEYLNSGNFNFKLEDRWKAIGYFETESDAQIFVDRTQSIDDAITNTINRGYDLYTYEIRESYYDRGVFYVHIPISQIPSNFYLLDTENIEALIQRTKPFGTKALIRYMVEDEFNHNLEFISYPAYRLYSDIDMGEFELANYFIQSKKEGKIIERICNKEVETYGMVPSGLTAIYNGPNEHDIEILPEQLKPTVYTAYNTQNLIAKNKKRCKTKACRQEMTNRPYPDNSLNHELECSVKMDATVEDNPLRTLTDLSNILYQNDFTNISFNIPSNVVDTIKINDTDIQESQNSIVNKWMKANNYRSFSYPITRMFDKMGLYKFTNKNKYCDAFKINVMQRKSFDVENEIGIGFTDVYDRHHLFSLKYNQTYKQDYIKYSTVFNNNFKMQKDGLTNASALVFKIIRAENDYKNNIVVFFTENEGVLHYFHHVIVSDLKQVFIFMNNELAQYKQYEYYDGTKQIKYQNDKGEILPLKKDSMGQILLDKTMSYVDDNGVTQKGTPVFTIENLPDKEIGAYIKYGRKSKDKVTFETPYYNEFDMYEATHLANGEGWNNLYRINKAENSYTYVQNDTNEVMDVDSIELHFSDIVIPENSIIKDIRLKTIISSSYDKPINCSATYQSNHLLEGCDGYRLRLHNRTIEFYHQTKEGQYYYIRQLEQAQTENKANYYINLINENILFDESFNLEDNLIIQNPHWIEIADFTDNPYSFNDIQNISFVIEGFNTGPEIDILSQLLYEDDVGTLVSYKIPSGYFYEKISLPFSNSYMLDWLRLRFRFDRLNNPIQIFNSCIDIKFKTKQQFEIFYSDCDEVYNTDKNIYYLNALIEDNITAQDLNNGMTVLLDFDGLNPGEFYKIYSTELQIIYQRQDMSLLINKNKFIPNRSTDKYVVVSGDTENTYLSGKFYDDAEFISQTSSSTGPDNFGYELRDTLYQAFKLNHDNITSIEIFPNGFKGNPDNTLKLGIYENHGFSPGKLIKEVYINGWNKANNQLKKLNSIKYEINVNGLETNTLYWFKIEVENPSENNYYLLKYTIDRWQDFKLLTKENNNYINTSGSLKFNIYSKNLSTSFNQLPIVEDYLVDPYIEIGLHRGQGTIKNLSVKKSQEIIKKVDFDDNLFK